MKYTKNSTVQGGWVKATEVKSGIKAKLVSETTPIEGEFGMQDVAKIRFQGEQGEAKNVRINKPTINALIDAFGDDSKNWIGKILTAHTEKMLVAGKRVTALYLIPDGFEIGEDEGGYLVIRRDNLTSDGTPVPFPEDDVPEIDASDIPF